MAKAQKKRHYTGPVLAIIAVAGVVALLAAALAPQAVPVAMGRVRRGPMELVVHEDGRTRVKAHYVVSAPLAGNLARPVLEPGQRVEEGEILARLLPLTPALLDQRTRLQADARVAAASANEKRLAAEISRAETAFEFASQQTARHESLRQGQHVSEAEIDRARMTERTSQEALKAAQFAHRVAAYELRMAKAALGSISGTSDPGSELEITAPTTGQVLRVLQKSEGVVQPGTPLLELGDISQLEVVVEVLSTDAVHIPVGAPARIVRWGGEGPLKARVRSKEPSAFTTRSPLGVEEQRVNVVLRLSDPENERRGLGDGYRVEADIQTWHSDSVLRVPASAVFRDEEGWSVFAVGADSVVERRSFEAGRHGPRWVEVRDGLREGQVVALYPTDRITTGTRVKAR